MEADGTIRTVRLLLEPLAHEHAAELFPALSDPRLYSFIPRDPPRTVAELETRLRRIEVRCAPCRQELWLNWTVRTEGQAIGRIEVTVRDDRTALLAYELAPTHWGRGLATEACAAVLEALWTEYPLDRIIAEVDTRNAPSIKLLERLAFTRTATHLADPFKGTPSHEHVYVLPRPT